MERNCYNSSTMYYQKRSANYILFVAQRIIYLKKLYTVGYMFDYIIVSPLPVQTLEANIYSYSLDN